MTIYRFFTEKAVASILLSLIREVVFGVGFASLPYFLSAEHIIN